MVWKSWITSLNLLLSSINFSIEIKIIKSEIVSSLAPLSTLDSEVIAPLRLEDHLHRALVLIGIALEVPLYFQDIGLHVEAGDVDDVELLQDGSWK